MQPVGYTPWCSTNTVVVTTGAWGWSSEALELRVEGGQVRPSYGQGRYGVVPPRALYIVAISVLQIWLPHHTIGSRRPQKFPPNAASVEEQGDDHCWSEPSRCLPSWKRTFQSAHKGERHVYLLQPSMLDGRGRQERRMRAICVAALSALSGCVSAAPSLARWSASLLPGRSQWPGGNTIRMDFDIASTAACSRMSDESAELALLTAWATDLQSQMMIAEAHGEMEDSHWMTSLWAAFFAWKELL